VLTSPQLLLENEPCSSLVRLESPTFSFSDIPTSIGNSRSKSPNEDNQKRFKDHYRSLDLEKKNPSSLIEHEFKGGSHCGDHRSTRLVIQSNSASPSQDMRLPKWTPSDISKDPAE
jgi:hypothetical protein